MRRLRDRPPRSLFRGAELPRLLTMVIMLGVIALLIGLARDTNTWRWLAPDAGNDNPREVAALPAVGANDAAAEDAPATGPTDEDADEQDAAREELQVISDKVPFSKEEMPAYWRLMAWQQHQSTRQLLDRAQTTTYNELWQRPDKWRGKLLQFAVHLRQTVRLDDLPANPLGIKTLYEVCGWNSDSQPYWYWMVTPELPPGMPSGQDIYEEATFVGYFIKLQPYEDREGKSRAMPVLIGRLIWHPAADNPLARGDEWTWPWYLAGALAVLFAARWALTLAGRRRSAASYPAGRTDHEQVEAWLDDAENTPDQAAFDEHDADDDEQRSGW